MITLKKFFAVWCGPCKAYDKILDKFEEEFPHVKVEKYDIDDDSSNELVEKYKVKNLPYTVIEVDGEIKYKSAGIIDLQTLSSVIANINQ